MGCKSCAEHRAAIQAAMRSGSVSAVVKVTAAASKALGEDAGRRAIRTFGTSKPRR